MTSTSFSLPLEEREKGINLETNLLKAFLENYMNPVLLLDIFSKSLGILVSHTGDIIDHPSVKVITEELVLRGHFVVIFNEIIIQ